MGINIINPLNNSEMEQKRIKGIRVGSSNHDARLAALKANHESDELKALLARGYKIQSARRRPRIQKPKTPKEVEVSIFGGKVRMTFAEYQLHGQGFKVLMEIF